MERNRDVTEFSNHLQTREQVLEKFVAILMSKEFCARSCRICSTSWVSWILGLETFLQIYEALVKIIEEIYNDNEGKFNQDSVKKVFFNH